MASKCGYTLPAVPGEHNAKRCPEKAGGDSIYCAEHRLMLVERVKAMNVTPAMVNLSESRPWFRPRWHTWRNA